jgi:NADPH-dependent F420 reductase
VILGSRDEAKARSATEKAREAVPEVAMEGAPNSQAAAGADVVVLTVPFAGQEAILDEIREGAAGKVVIDTTVPLRTYAPPQLELVIDGSSAQRVQRILPESRVVAAFHSVSARRLRRFGEPLQEDTPVCGDDERAKRIAIELAERIGLRGLDVGGLEVAHALEYLAVVILRLNERYERKAVGVRFVGL